MDSPYNFISFNDGESPPCPQWCFTRWIAVRPPFCHPPAGLPLTRPTFILMVRHKQLQGLPQMHNTELIVTSDAFQRRKWVEGSIRKRSSLSLCKTHRKFWGLLPFLRFTWPSGGIKQQQHCRRRGAWDNHEKGTRLRLHMVRQQSDSSCSAAHKSAQRPL